VGGLDLSAPLDQSGYHDSLTATAAWLCRSDDHDRKRIPVLLGASEAANATCASPASGWVIESQTNPATVCLLDRVVSATGCNQASVTASTAQNYAMEIVHSKAVIVGATSALREFCPIRTPELKGRVCRASSSPQQFPDRGDLQLWWRYNGEFLHV